MRIFDFDPTVMLRRAYRVLGVESLFSSLEAEMLGYWWMAFGFVSGAIAAIALPLFVLFVGLVVVGKVSDKPDSPKKKMWRDYQDEANSLLRARNDIGDDQAKHLDSIAKNLHVVSLQLKALSGKETVSADSKNNNGGES